MHPTGTSDYWKLYRVPFVEQPLVGDAQSNLAWKDLPVREEASGIRAGQWFLLPGVGGPDEDVLAFFNSLHFKSKSRATQTAYARDLKTHLQFLSSKGADWRSAAVADIEDYEFWRRRDIRNPRTVSSSKFMRELAACRLFYEFQVKRGAIGTSPILLTTYRKYDGSVGVGVRMFIKAEAANEVKWLTPRAYRKWRNVGLGGYLPEGTADPSSRSRNESRNIAFVETLWSSGLRLREAALLLVNDLPTVEADRRFHRARVGTGVAKNRIARDFWLSNDAMARIVGYRNYARRMAISRARAEGRYESIPGRIVIQSIIGNSVGRTALKTGLVGKVRLDRLEEEERMRTFLETEEGLEPLMLWLGDSGLPLRPSSWYATFNSANARVAGHEIGTDAGPLYCRPHMMRHSFALRMLIALQRALENRMGLSPEERKEYRMLFGDPWVLVAQLLGHSSVQTTRDIYLEPVKGLQIDSLLNDEMDAEDGVSDILAEIALDTGLVHDVNELAEGME